MTKPVRVSESLALYDPIPAVGKSVHPAKGTATASVGRFTEVGSREEKPCPSTYPALKDPVLR